VELKYANPKKDIVARDLNVVDVFILNFFKLKFKKKFYIFHFQEDAVIACDTRLFTIFKLLIQME